MSDPPDVLNISSEEETSLKLSSVVMPAPLEKSLDVHFAICTRSDSDKDDEPTSIVSIDDGETETDPSDCEIISVEDASGEEKWRNIQSPIKMLNTLLQAGYNDPGQLLSRMFGMSQKSIPTDSSQQWGLLLTLLTEPPRRPRLRHVHTLENVLELLNKCRSILVVTGAGISVSCGIPDFRSRDGVYARLAKDYPDLSSPQAMFDMTYFLRNPSPFFKFAKEIFPGQFSPSPTHKFVALLESKDKLLRNYTQNIDTLEQAAGITRLIQCHGSFMTATCVTCKYRVSGRDIKESVLAQRIPYCPRCRPGESYEDSDKVIPWRPLERHTRSKDLATQPIKTYEPCYGVLKPDIVFFGEDLSSEFHDALAADVNTTDLVLVIGSSLKVRPVAHIPNSIPEHIPQILINREPLSNHDFDVELLGDCDVIVCELCARLGWQLDAGRFSSEPRSLVSIHELINEESGVHVQSETRRSPSPISSESVIEEYDTSDITINSTLYKDKNIRKSSSEKAKCQLRAEPDDVIAAVGPETEVVEVVDSDDDCDTDDLLDVATLLPDNSYTYIPPNHYVFPGAELFVSQRELFDEKSSSSSNSSSDAPSIRAQLDAHTIPLTAALEPKANQELFNRIVKQPSVEKTKVDFPQPTTNKQSRTETLDSEHHIKTDLENNFVDPFANESTNRDCDTADGPAIKRARNDFQQPTHRSD